MPDPSPLALHLMPSARRHAALLNALDALQPGESFEFVDREDPAPLYYRCDRERPGQAQWTYLRCGPDEWAVRVQRRASPSGVLGNS